MKRLLVGASLVALAVLPVRTQEPVFRGVERSVRVFATVTDDDDRLVPSLTREQFEVRDNGKVQPITLFDNSPQPIRLIVMIDVSGSMVGNLNLVRAASVALFEHLRPGDMAKVGMFGNDVEISPEFTDNRRALAAALPTTIDAGAATALWKGVDQAMSSFGDTPERRVVLVLSDGKDSPPMNFAFRQKYIDQLTVVDRAVREDVMIYGIGMRSRGQPVQMGGGVAGMKAAMIADLPDPGLGLTATQTGGGYLEIRPQQDLATAFTRVAAELHSQYMIGFAPPALDGKTHKIELKVTGKGLETRARKSYVAPRSN